jgi:acetylglutamate kinase
VRPAGERHAVVTRVPAPGHAAAAARVAAGPAVIKIGGRALEMPGAPEQLAAEVAALARPALLVHGGGHEVSRWCARLSIPPRFIDGLRVTDAETLEVAVAVLAGLANRRLVALLRHAGVDAVGLAALDGGIVEVEPHPNAAALGRVGVVRRVREALLAALLAGNRTPVLASIGDWRGELLNLNADELAASLAAALGADTLVLLSDAPGVVLGGRRVSAIAPEELADLRAHPEVRDGMVAKLDAAGKAMAGGVRRVRIAAWSGPGTLGELLGGGTGGTTIVQAGSPLAETLIQGRSS